MESKGWSFNWNDENVFASGDERCRRVPKNSYCGYRKDGQGTISYTLRNGSSGVATLRYDQSSDKGSVSIAKNDIRTRLIRILTCDIILTVLYFGIKLGFHILIVL